MSIWTKSIYTRGRLQRYVVGIAYGTVHYIEFRAGLDTHWSEVKTMAMAEFEGWAKA